MHESTGRAQGGRTIGSTYCAVLQQQGEDELAIEPAQKDRRAQQPQPQGCRVQQHCNVRFMHRQLASAANKSAGRAASNILQRSVATARAAAAVTDNQQCSLCADATTAASPSVAADAYLQHKTDNCGLVKLPLTLQPQPIPEYWGSPQPPKQDEGQQLLGLRHGQQHGQLRHGQQYHQRKQALMSKQQLVAALSDLHRPPPGFIATRAQERSTERLWYSQLQQQLSEQEQTPISHQQQLQATSMLSWLPKLLQQDALYKPCASCHNLQEVQGAHRKSCPLRLFNLGDGRSLYCNSCSPSTAVEIGGKHEPAADVIAAALTNISQQKPQQPVVLLALLNTGMASKVGIKLSAAAALGLSVSDIRTWNRKQQQGRNKIFLLLHPQSGRSHAAAVAAADGTESWRCMHCRVGREEELYCSVSCKLRAQGLMGFLPAQQHLDQQPQMLLEQQQQKHTAALKRRRQQQQQHLQQQQHGAEQSGRKRQRQCPPVTAAQCPASGPPDGLTAMSASANSGSTTVADISARVAGSGAEDIPAVKQLETTLSDQAQQPQQHKNQRQQPQEQQSCDIVASAPATGGTGNRFAASMHDTAGAAAAGMGGSKGGADYGCVFSELDEQEVWDTIVPQLLGFLQQEDRQAASPPPTTLQQQQQGAAPLHRASAGLGAGSACLVAGARQRPKQARATQSALQLSLKTVACQGHEHSSGAAAGAAEQQQQQHGKMLAKKPQSRVVQQQQQQQQQQSPSQVSAAHSGRSTLGPRKQGHVSRVPWGPDLIGVPLGCSSCRYLKYGCLNCRAKARKALAEQRQAPQAAPHVARPEHKAVCLQLQQHKQQAQQCKLAKQQQPSVTAAAAAAPPASKRRRLSAPTGCCAQQQPKLIPQQQHKLTAAEARLHVPAIAAATTVAISRNVDASDIAGLRHGRKASSQGFMTALQQRQQRHQEQVAEQTATDDSRQQSVHQPSSMSWLPALLQQQGFYQNCPRCTKPRPARWFDVHHPDHTYCNGCRPAGAFCLGTPKQQELLRRQQQQQVGEWQQRPVLLPLIHSGSSARLWGGQPVVIPAVSPADLAALQVHHDDLSTKLRDQGHHVKKEVILLHPIASSARTAAGECCRACSVLQQGSGPQFCSIACKLQHSGLESFAAISAAASTQQQQQQEYMRQQTGPPAAQHSLQQPQQASCSGSTQQQVYTQQQQRGCSRRVAKAPDTRRCKFPPLRLSELQVTWRETAWQQQQAAGLAKLAEVHAANKAAADTSTGATVAGVPGTAVLLLLHGTGWPTAAVWQAWQAQAGPDDVRLFCHVKQGVDVCSEQLPGRNMVQRHLLQTRVNAKWGDTSLVEATLDSLTEILLSCSVLHTFQAAAAATPSNATSTSPSAVAADPAPVEHCAGEDAVLGTLGLPETCTEELPSGNSAGGSLMGHQQWLHAPDDHPQQQQQPAKEDQQFMQRPDAGSRTITDPRACQHEKGSCSMSPPTDAAVTVSADAAATADLAAATAEAAEAAGAVAMDTAAPHRGLKHILLASGTDIPLRLLPAAALPIGVTLYGSYDYPEDAVADIQEVVFEGMMDAGFSAAEAKQWASCLVPHHQWMCLSVEHALVLVSMRDLILKVAGAVHVALQKAKCDIAADEFVLMTALRVAGCVRELRTCRSSRHFAGYPPGTAANCHPTQVIYPVSMRWMQQLHAQGHADTGPAPAEGGIEQAPAADACQVSLGSARVVAHATAHALADISMASSSKATDGRMPETASNDDTPYAQQQLQCPAAAASIAEADSDLPLASPADGKHPVTWRCVKHTVWCEDEKSGTTQAVKMSLRNLLAIAAERGCLALRKVDCSNDPNAESKLQRLLQSVWEGQAPKVRSAQQVAMLCS